MPPRTRSVTRRLVPGPRRGGAPVPAHGERAWCGVALCGGSFAPPHTQTPGLAQTLGDIVAFTTEVLPAGETGSTGINCLMARGQLVDQCLGGVTAVQQRSDVVAGSPQRFEGGYPYQRLPAQVEDHRVPGRGGDLTGVAA